MGLFEKDELALLDLIAAKKKLTVDDKEALEPLGEKLGVTSHRPGDLLDRFVLLTGWANSPKDYPL
jgi:hypothetical protein